MLRRLADEVRQLTVDRRNPEQFHFAKDQIAFDLRRLARKIEISRAGDQVREGAL
jgi:hypothetical protein